MSQIMKRKLETLEENFCVLDSHPKTKTTFTSQDFGEIRQILKNGNYMFLAEYGCVQKS